MQAIKNFLPIYLILVYGLPYFGIWFTLFWYMVYLILVYSFSTVELYLIDRLANLCRFQRDTISQQNLTKWRRPS